MLFSKFVEKAKGERRKKSFALVIFLKKRRVSEGRRAGDFRKERSEGKKRKRVAERTRKKEKKE